jgi:hypothetical protein
MLFFRIVISSTETMTAHYMTKVNVQNLGLDCDYRGFTYSICEKYSEVVVYKNDFV